MKILVSVVIVNYNRRELLLACLGSLERQTLAGFEVILVDNGSTDGSVEEAASRFANSFPSGWRVIRNKENRGFCAANNQGFSESSGEFVALLNNDAEAEPGWLAGLLTGISVADDVGMAASKILVYEDSRRIDKAGHLIYPDGQNRGRGSGEIDRGQFDRMEEVLWPDGCAALYRKEMLEEIGGFDEDLFAYGDDAELGMRARVAGWRCFYMPSAVVRHHRGSTLGVLSSRRLELIEELDIQSRISEIRAPVLFIAGDKDLLIPSAREARLMASLMPNATVKIIKGAGHACLLGERVSLARLLHEWEQELTQRVMEL